MFAYCLLGEYFVIITPTTLMFSLKNTSEFFNIVESIFKLVFGV